MTEKRFTRDYNGDEHLLTHFLNNGKPMTKGEVLNQLNKLHKENQELKKELQTYHKVVGCFNCYYHNYDWYDDGDEFEVCDRGNDITEGICKEWEEL